MDSTVESKVDSMNTVQERIKRTNERYLDVALIIKITFKIQNIVPFK